MKRYEVTIEIPAEMLVEYEKMLSYDADDMIANGIPPLGNISTWSAKAYCEECVRESLRDFPDEKMVDGEYVVQTYDEAGNPDYGCVWSVLEV